MRLYTARVLTTDSVFADLWSDGDVCDIFYWCYISIAFSAMEVSMAAEILDVPFDALNDTCIGLTHCGLVTPFGDIYVGQHWPWQWLDAWQHQVITWSNDEFSLVQFMVLTGKQFISRRVIKILSCIISLKYVLLQLLPHFMMDKDLIWC